jgi:hypothetical protein
MIRIFRHIRQKLIEQENMRKYVWYALGEILLVMIGILLALQVNNWNEERLATMKAVSYHERIIEDLDIFISETESAVRRSTSFRNMILETVDILESKKLPEDKIRFFENTLHFYYQIPYRSPSLTTLAEMRSNGELDLIRNLDLRKKLIQMEQDILSTDEIFVQIGYQTQEPIFYVDQYVRYLPDTSSITANRVRMNVDADFEAMANDKKLLNYFSKFSVQWSHHLMFSKGLNESAIELRDDFIQELDTIQ